MISFQDKRTSSLELNSSNRGYFPEKEQRPRRSFPLVVQQPASTVAAGPGQLRGNESLVGPGSLNCSTTAQCLTEGVDLVLYALGPFVKLRKIWKNLRSLDKILSTQGLLIFLSCK